MSDYLELSLGLSEEELLILQQYCQDHRVQTVLEFGPGRTTRAMLDAPVRHIDSYEASPGFLLQARQALTDPRLHLHLYDQPRTIQGGLNFRPPLQQYDLALVDGPYGGTYRWCSRLDSCLISCRYSRRLILHDAQRKKERRTIWALQELGCVPSYLSPRLVELLVP